MVCRYPPARLDEVARHYEAVGGKSPLNEITFRQADSLKTFLNNKLPVYVGMRNAAPFLVDTLSTDGRRRRHARPRVSFYRHIAAKRAGSATSEISPTPAPSLAASAPEVDYCDGWHDHPLFIQNWVEQIETAMTKIEAVERPSTALVFTAHSLPAAMAARSPYVEQLDEQRSADRGGAKPPALVACLSKPQRPAGRSLARTGYRSNDPRPGRAGR